MSAQDQRGMSLASCHRTKTWRKAVRTKNLMNEELSDAQGFRYQDLSEKDPQAPSLQMKATQVSKGFHLEAEN